MFCFQMIDLAKEGDEETINSWITVSHISLSYILSGLRQLGLHVCVVEGRGFLIDISISKNLGVSRWT